MSERRAAFVAPAAVSALFAAHLAYYIVIVQFALLGHYARLGLGIEALRMPLGALTVCGIASAWFTGRRLDRTPPDPLALFGAIALLAIGIASLGVAGFALRSVGAITALFASLGALLGAQIVLLLSAFHTRIPAVRRGVYAGGVAAATYLAANLIAGFAPTPEAAGLACALMLAFAVAIVVVLRRSFLDSSTHDVCQGTGTIAEVARSSVPLAFLVAVDSFVFYPVGQGGIAAHPVFASSGDWVANGIWHVVFAIAAGVFFSRVGFRRLVAIGCAAMMLAALALVANETRDLTAWVRAFYSMVVGTYTVALVAAPGSVGIARSPQASIAIVMILAGFIANPAGIGAYLSIGTNLSAPGLWVTGAIMAAVALAVALVAARRGDPRVRHATSQVKTS